MLYLFFLLCVTSTLVSSVPVRPVTADDALDAYVRSRFVGVIRKDVNASEVVRRLERDAAVYRRGPPEHLMNTDAAEIGVVSFKLVRGTNVSRWLVDGSKYFKRVAREQRYSVGQRLVRRPASPPPVPPVLFYPQTDTCNQTLEKRLWGLDRTDNPSRLDGVFIYGPCRDGTSVHMFVVDSGVYPHAELAGRLSPVSTCTLPPRMCAKGARWYDDNGHGTLSATTAAGTTVGVAKNAMVHAVKVIASSGFGTTSTVVAGLYWVRDTVLKHPELRPALVTASLGGANSTILTDAVAELTQAGITVVVAAGNQAEDACVHSPGNAPSALTVGAMDDALGAAAYSNTGECVDLFAPGTNIYAASNGANKYEVWTGTSAAAPAVSGTAALMLSRRPCMTPEQVHATIKSSAVIIGTAQLVNSLSAALASTEDVRC